MRSTLYALIGLLTLLGAAFAAISASAAPADTHVTLTAAEGPDCAGDQATFCFQVTNGSLEDWPAGGVVHLTLENPGMASHNAYLTNISNADTTGADTPGSAAFANTDTADPGATVNVSFTVPEGASELYIWCDIQGHEALGMFLTATVSEAPDDGDEQDPGTGENETGNGNESGNGPTGNASQDENGSPAPGLALLAAATGIGAYMARRGDTR